MVNLVKLWFAANARQGRLRPGRRKGEIEPVEHLPSDRDDEDAEAKPRPSRCGRGALTASPSMSLFCLFLLCFFGMFLVLSLLLQLPLLSPSSLSFLSFLSPSSSASRTPSPLAQHIIHQFSSSPLFLHNWDPSHYRVPGDLPLIVVCHAHWMGIRSATEMLGFPTVLRNDDSDLPWDQALLELISRWAVSTVVINGVPPRSLALAERLHAQGIRVIAIYHGSFAQQHSDNLPEAEAFAGIMEGLEAGTIARLGLVKNEMVNVVNDLGVAAYPVSNMVVRSDGLYGISLSAVQGRVHIGVLGGKTLGKNVVTQLAAACTIPNAVVHILALDFKLSWLKHCKAEVQQHAPRSALAFQKLVSQMDLNLYVSMHECQPMVALESIAAGVPCIISDTSTIFQSDPDLQKLLVCPQQDAPDAIQSCLAAVIPHLGPDLRQRVQRHIVRVNADAVRAFATLLDLDPFSLFGHRTDLDLRWAPQPSAPLPAAPPLGGAAPPLQLLPVVDAGLSGAAAPSPPPPPPMATPLWPAAQLSPNSVAACPLPISLNNPGRRTIVLVTYELAGANAGGAGTVIHGLAMALWRSGTRVIILADMPQREAELYMQEQIAPHTAKGAVSLRLLADLVPPKSGSFCGKAVQWALGAEQLYRLQPYDAIEFFEYAGPAALLLARRYQRDRPNTLPSSVKIVVRIHGSLEFISTAESEESREGYSAERENMFAMERFAMHAADFVVAPSSALASLYASQCHLEWQRLVIGVPPVVSSLQGINAQALMCSPQIQQRQRQRTTPFKFLILGKIQAIKNPALVVKAALRLFSLHPDLDVVFTFRGIVTDQSLLLLMQKSIPDALRSRFEFGPAIPRDALAATACQYDAAIIASAFESFNMVAHELTYLGLPLVISNFPAFTPYFNAKNSFIYQHLDVESLQLALYRAITDFVQISALEYPTPTTPYDCILKSPVLSPADHLAWWESTKSRPAHFLLDNIHCEDELEIFERL